MKKSDKHLSDLGYLAAEGFRHLPASGQEIVQLRKNVRKRFQARRFGTARWLFMAFLVLGTYFSYRFFTQTEPTQVTVADEASQEAVMDRTEVILPEITAPEEYHKAEEEVQSSAGVQRNETTVPASEAVNELFVPLTPVRAPSLPVSEDEATPKFSYNAPVRFVADCKITDYDRLYNPRRQSELPVGTNASQSGERPAQTSVREFRRKATGATEIIENAMICFQRGEYRECLYQLHLLSEVNAEDPNCDFYASMCHLRLGRCKPAAGGFDKCLASANNTFHQEAQYHKALAQALCGELDRARATMQLIKEEKMFYAGRAAEWLSRNSE